MLQKCYNRNNSVTNVKSGSRCDNVHSGDQIVHPPIGTHSYALAHTIYYILYIRA
jgi:hypothetical protein